MHSREHEGAGNENNNRGQFVVRKLLKMKNEERKLVSIDTRLTFKATIIFIYNNLILRPI